MRSRAWGLGVVVALACAPEPPNVVLISVDTLRADRLGLYGNRGGTTPRLDRFFSAGSVFERAVSPSPCTLPAVPQLLAGSFLVGPERPTLAELLAERGYRTHAIASQHQFRPGDQGRATHIAAAAQVQRGFEVFDLQAPGERDHHGLSTRSASQVSERALRWLEADPPSQPFFLWLHYFDPHDPYEPPPAYRPEAGAAAGSGDRRLRLQRERRSPTEPWQRAGYVFDAAEVAALRRLYDGEVRYADAEIGRVLDALERRGLVERSVVALVSDHGEWLGEDGRWDHCQTLREAELHVPLLLRLRGRPLGEPARVAAPVSSLDLAPTLLALAGGDPGELRLDGVDLRGAPPERPVFAAWSGRAALYRGPWKLIQGGHPARPLRSDPSGRGPRALFRLDRDPAERHDLLGRGVPGEAALAAELGAFARERADLEAQNARTLEGLRALGYVE